MSNYEIIGLMSGTSLDGLDIAHVRFDLTNNSTDSFVLLNADSVPLPAELIEKLMKAYRLDGKMKELDIINSWEEMMGKAVATRTKEIYIKNKTLFLVMDSSVMREELSYGKQIIIERINQKAGFQMISNIYFG